MFERLRASLELDTSGFRSGVNDAQDDMDSLESRTQDVGKSMQKAGAGLTAGVTLPIGAMGAKALTAAADAEELRDRSRAVFQDMSDDVFEWAEQTADDMGRSENQLLDMATGMQDMLDPTGNATEEVMGLSMGMAELAEDVGSFQNMDSEQVMGKFQSAMAGQSRAVRDLGVNMSAAAVEQELLNQGIEGGTEAATDAEEAQARYNILMRETQAAHGDAERTADTFTGAMRRARARMSDLAAEMGQHLLPAATLLLTNFDGLIDLFDGLSERQQRMIVIVAALAAAIGPLLLALGTLITMLPVIIAGAKVLAGVVAALASPIALVAAAVVALYLAWQTNFLGIQDITNDVIEGVRGLIAPFLTWLTGLWEQHGQRLVEDATETWNHFRGLITGFVEWMKPYVTGFVDFLTSAFRGLWDIVSPLFEAQLNNIVDIASFAFNTIRTVIEGALDAITSIISAGLALLRGDWDEAWTAIADMTGRQLDRIVDIVTGFGSTLLGAFENTISGVIGVFENLYNTLIGNSIIPDMLSDIISAVTNWDISDAFSGALDGALGVITGIAGDFKDAGANLAGSVADGIKDSISDVGDAATDMAGEARDKLPFSPAKEGPLKDIDEAGPALANEFADGMESGEGRVDEASREMAGRARPRSGSGSGSGVTIIVEELIADNPRSAANELKRELRSHNLTRSQ